MAKVYKLLQGKMHRWNPETKQNERFVKGDQFVPTASELAGNRAHLVYVGDIPDDGRKITVDANTLADHVLTDTSSITVALEPQISAIIPENIQKAAVLIPEDIAQVRVKEALGYIDTVVSTDELDRIFEQELAGKPKARRSVLEAIEERRLEITPKSVQTIVQEGTLIE